MTSMSSEKTTKRSTLLSKRKPKAKEGSDNDINVKPPKAKTPSVRVKKTSLVKVPTPKAPKTPKTPKTEKKSKRKINMNPTLSEKAGLNISVARVKNIVDAFIINRDEFLAATEVRQAYHPTEKDDAGVDKDITSIPINKLSVETQNLIKKAKYFYDRADKEEFEKLKIGTFSDSEKTTYSEAKKVSKEMFEERMRLIPEFDRGVFDIELFNLSYDKKFYKDFKASTNDDDEWQNALSHLSKLRVRFSANSKILLSSFIELLLRQIAVNGTYNCIQNKKKIIKLSHALQTNAHTSEYFPLFSLVSNTQTYRKFKEAEPKVSPDTEEEVEDLDEVPDNEDDSSRPNFRFYVSEICRNVRMKLASNELNINADSTEDKEVYNLTNVSRDFKDFCNSLIFETVTILGRMILTEINTRGVKTLNDIIMKTVIEHLHSAYSMDFKTSLSYIETSTKQYNLFVKNRRSSRKTTTEETVDPAEGYEVKYAEE